VDTTGDPMLSDLVDDDPLTLFTSVALRPYDTRIVHYFAIVEKKTYNIDRVYADIWHPDESFKYQIEMYRLDLLAGIDAFNHVWYNFRNALVDNIHEGYDLTIDQLQQEEAFVYEGWAEISYCQPAGKYTVGVTAIDGLDTWSDYLLNKFWYIPTAAVAIDFKTVDYGEVVESVWQQVGGDKVMGTEKLPTVKNIGNTPVYFTIKQDDMGFGKTEPNWNVEYKARLGKDGIFTDPYEPNIRTRIPGYLGMCIEEKLDFLIHVIKGFPDGQPNEGLMSLCAHIYGDPPMWISPKTFPPAPQGVPQEAPPVP
jgi:hypothetical protein